MKSAETPHSEDPRETALRFFRSGIERGRLSHAYILLGPEGSDKTGFALELARTLLCGSGCKPGGAQCAVCKQVASGSHPDVQMLAPAATGGRLLIEATREMRRQAYMARFDGRYKIFIVEQADGMTEAAQNQILKVLEEPPPGTLMLLLAANLAGLLATVVSRCAVVRLGGLSDEAVLSKLSGRKEFPREEIEWAARFGRGSVSRALRLLESGAPKFNGLAARAVSSDAPDADMALADVLKEFSSAGENFQERRTLALEAFDLLAVLLRDALAAKLDIRPAKMYNMSESHNVAAIARLFATDDITDLLSAIADMQRRIGQNLNVELLCDCLAQEVFKRRTKAAQ